MNYVNGEWVIVEGADLNADGDLVFTTENAGAYAVVVSTGAQPTGDWVTYIAVAFFAVAAVAMAVVLVKTKKRV